VLRRHVRTTIADSPAVSQEVDEFVQILTPAGASAADVAVAYSPPFETVASSTASCAGPTARSPGSIPRTCATRARLRPTATRGRSRGSSRCLAPSRRDRARAPDQRVAHVPAAGRAARRPVADALPVRELRIEVRTKADAPLHHVFTDGLARAPVEERTTYGISRTWVLRDLPATPPDPLAPPETAPRLLLSTFDGWGAFAAWYGRIIREADQLTPSCARSRTS
jgi:hypothetical protein